uniref:PIN domain-containing protein n=1 Tax=Anopheles culicifacies TaxID=139723 RepID=A0A182LYF7_9DIPT
MGFVFKIDKKWLECIRALDELLVVTSVYTLMKGQDEQKATLTVNDILQPSFQLSHRVLVSQCIQLIFEDFESVGQKSREILWRKGYYDVVSVLKRQKGRADEAALLHAADRLIREGINYFKAIVLRFQQIFNLDSLRYLVDFALLEDYDMAMLREEPSCYSLLQLQIQDDAAVKELYTKQEIAYALETIHALLISLGDLHRYQLEFGIGNRMQLRERVRKYYLEAFKLNPKVGMPHNQLGMLVGDQNGHLDAVYHYLYSLCCPIPFECSEANVNVVFQKNIRHLDSNGELASGVMDGNDLLVDEFITMFLLVVDVFFYDKVVTDFNALCHTVLMKFKNILSIRQLVDEYYLTDEMLFKIVSILFFCMHRIKVIGSIKIHSLNAFMVALCSDLVQLCTSSFEKFTSEHSLEDARFQELYLRRYQRYSAQVYRARDKVRNRSTMFSKDQKSSSGVEEGTGSQDSRGNKNEGTDHVGNGSLTSTNASGSKASSHHGRGTNSRQKKHSRRRRRAYSNETDSEDGERYEDEYEGESEDDYYDRSGTLSSSSEEEEEDEDDEMSLSSYGSYDECSDEEDNDHEEEEEEDRDGSDEEDDHTGQHHEDEQHGNNVDEEISPELLKFKKRYQKLDPNIVLEFALSERTMRSLKILFDWLLCNIDVLHNCYQSNPEFLHNIMKLLNGFNLDFFTNRFYFTRDLITEQGLREDLQEIFNVRRTVPLQEDIAMKRFPLFEPVQEGLLWETSYKLGISEEEESFLRLMKMVDFGFAVCKSKKFDYCFHPKVRAFKLRIGFHGSGGSNNGRNKLSSKGQRNGGKQRRKGGDTAGGNKRDWNAVGGGDAGNRTRGLSYSQSRTGRAVKGSGIGEEKNRRRPVEYNDHRREELANDALISREPNKRQRNRARNKARNGNEERGLVDGHETAAPTLFTKKGYLHNRSNGMLMQRGVVSDVADHEMQRERKAAHQEKGDISAIMGQLWLKNEVETLESKVNKGAGNVTLTPYLVLDSKCLTEYTSIVKNLIRTKKFVVLIPGAVLGDLDELKKHSEGARNAIKWLEVELNKGNRFLRAQKNHESLPMPLVKIPKKLDREGAVFNQIVQFCNHIVTTQADNDNDIITYLSGDNLQEKKLCNGSSYIGILEAIPVKFEQIVTFYSSYKRK